MLAHDPFDPAVIHDPFPFYTRLRAEAPVYRVERLDLWVLSRYQDVHAALRDPATFSPMSGMGLLLGGGTRWSPAEGWAPRWWRRSSSTSTAMGCR